MRPAKYYVRRVREAVMKRWPSAPPPRAGIPVPADPVETIPLLERLLFKNIDPYWFPSSIDTEYGGFILARDQRERLTGESYDRLLIMQARMFWYFSRMVSGGYAGADHLDAARHGFDYFREVMRDKEHGGYFWKVDARTGQPTMSRKHICGQAYVLFALSEYARASKSEEAAQMARDLFALFETKAHDPIYGGYNEFFEPDWRPCLEPEIGYLSTVPTGAKRHATHIHVFEAFLDYHDLTGDPVVYQRLLELIDILTVKVVRPEGPACTDNHAPDWTPLIRDGKRAVAYGHDVEAVWMASIGCERLGIERPPSVLAGKAIFDNAYRRGWDAENGGFFTSGPVNGPVYRRDKQWWTQAEALICALHLYQLTGEDLYRDCYIRTLDWIVNVHTDWKGGEWHNLVARNGRIMGNKADRWKAAYHTGRAVMTCLELLRRREAA